MKNLLSESLITVVSLAIILGFSACEKFEEGGPVGKAEKNLLGEWDLEKAFKNGSPVEEVPENPQIGEVTEDWWFFENGDVATEDGN